MKERNNIMERVIIKSLYENIGKKVLIKGWIHRVRRLKSITFVVIRDRSGLVQCVVENDSMNVNNLRLESVVTVTGEVKESNNSLNSFEVIVEELNVIVEANEELPIEINKKDLEVNLDTMLNNRVLSLRHEKKNAIFKIQNMITEGFREYLTQNDFTEIFSPKIVAEGAEGGTELFEVKYFENKAYLAQSPQFYKQMLVGAGFERVFEVGSFYRAELHNTNRHLNEYISMDLEMGFIENEEDIMDLEEALLKHILNKINDNGKRYLEILGAEIPRITGKIPRLKFKEALEILKIKYNKNDLEGDLDPEAEKLICKYAKEELGCEFVFLTNYPRRKRPMYTMPLGEDGTHSFDLLFRGLEITSGGQRINEYNQLVENIRYKGLNPDNYESYLNTFKYGMPPHGGLAIGLERLTAQLLNLSNVRETSLFPRDRTRLIP